MATFFGPEQQAENHRIANNVIWLEEAKKQYKLVLVVALYLCLVSRLGMSMNSATSESKPVLTMCLRQVSERTTHSVKVNGETCFTFALLFGFPNPT